MDFLGLIILALGVAAVTYVLATYVTFRIAVILWLAIVLFGLSLILMPHDTIVQRDNSGEMPGLKELAIFILFAAPAILGSTLGLIAAWIVRRKRANP